MDPFAGDVQPSKGHPVAFRRRVGNWRIFFEADRAHRVVEITDIVRCTSTTYRKRLGGANPHPSAPLKSNAAG